MDSDHDERLEIARLIIEAPVSKLRSLKKLYPEYFRASHSRGSLESISQVNTSYIRWKEDYGISREWLGEFPTNDIYNNYVRYCFENKCKNMSKKEFYHILEIDFNYHTERGA